MNKPQPIDLKAQDVPQLRRMQQSLERAIEEAHNSCEECQPPPEMLQALDNIEAEIASRYHDE
jgi:hypothetical protein